MMTPVCPRLLDMINDFVVLRFWARAPRGFKRYRSYIILLLLLFRVETVFKGIDKIQNTVQVKQLVKLLVIQTKNIVNDNKNIQRITF